MKTVSSSPHVHSSADSHKIMYVVVAALLPAALWGVFVFGLHALLVLLVSIASAVLVEFLLGTVSKEMTIQDGSALLTGLLVGMNMPPSVPLYVPVIASAFAIAVVKWTFGGLGCNWMNPALAGRVFVFFSFTTQMSATFRLPSTLIKSALSSTTPIDALSSATPLSVMKTAISEGAAGTASSLLEGAKMSSTAFARGLCPNNPYMVDAFLGNVSGCIGEVSALLLIVGGIFLIAKKVITWHIPVVYLGSFAILNWVFGGIPGGQGLFAGGILLPLFTGGLMLGAFFMATDFVTSPLTIKGQIIYAVGCGFFTFLIRNFGSLPEGTSLAIILMNILTPTIDRYCIPKKFGYVKPVKEGAN